MNWQWKVLLLLVLLGGLWSVPALSGEWPKIEAALSSWEGSKTLLLRSDLADPLASPVIQGLLVDLLEKGFLVTPGTAKSTVRDGLILDLRPAGEGQALALSRGKDGAIIAYEKSAGVSPSLIIPSATTALVSAAAVSDTAPRLDATSEPGSGPIELSGHPKNIALLGMSAGEGMDFALLYDHGLDSYRLQGTALQLLDQYHPNLSSARALHLSSGDLTGDGRKEIAAVWAQDVVGIYEGTDSQLYGRILSREGEKLTPLSPDLSGYLRIVGAKGYLQNRGPYAPFVGPVLPLIKTAGEFRPDSQGVAWAGADLYQATPLDNKTALVRSPEGNLLLRSMSTGKAYPGSVLLRDFSAFTGPQVAVRLETPEYRSGFGKDDRVKEAFFPLPGRIALGADGAAYTVLRGRSLGLPVFGKPSGRDVVGRVVRDGERLSLEKPFAEIETFIIDFVLLSESKRPGVLLLLNEKPDGSGRAYLLKQ